MSSAGSLLNSMRNMFTHRLLYFQSTLKLAIYPAPRNNRHEKEQTSKHGQLRNLKYIVWLRCHGRELRIVSIDCVSFTVSRTVRVDLHVRGRGSIFRANLVSLEAHTRIPNS